MTVPVVRFVVNGRDAGTVASQGRPYTVVFDGACRICNRLVRVLEAWDRNRQFEAVASQAPGVKARYPWIPERAYRESVQLVGPGGKTWQGAAAIERMLDVLPRGGWISWVFSIPGVRGFADRAYRWVARNRYRLGCGEHCQFRPEDLDYTNGTS